MFLKYHNTPCLKRLHADEDGVVSFEYIILAASIVTIVIVTFTGSASTTVGGAMGAAIGKVVSAMAAL